jgi:hypothetical protein
MTPDQSALYNNILDEAIVQHRLILDAKAALKELAVIAKDLGVTEKQFKETVKEIMGE